MPRMAHERPICRNFAAFAASKLAKVKRKEVPKYSQGYRAVNKEEPAMMTDGKKTCDEKSEKFCMDIGQIRKEAAGDIKEGAVTPNYKADTKEIIDMLGEALATEIVCVLRYRKHYYAARGINSEPVADEFLEHSNQELAHADKLAMRIRQLGGDPDLDPTTLMSRSHAHYTEATTLEGMIRENLIEERVAVETYRKMIEFIGAKDPTTRRLLEEILEQEEEHADELSDLLPQ